MELVEKEAMSTRDIHIDYETLKNNNLGILDPQRSNINPFTGLPYTSHFKKNVCTAHKWINVPMYINSLYDALKTLSENQVILIIGGTGSGKTLLSPYMAMHTLNYKGKIAITNPKILPSRSNAEQAETVTGGKIGVEIGIKYKGSPAEHYNASKVQFLYCTDGWLMKTMESDPYLTKFDMVMIDEAHERTWRIDMLLVMLKRAMLKRSDLKLGIISATIDQNQIYNYFPSHIYKYSMFDAKAASNHGVDEFWITDAFMNIHSQNALVKLDKKENELNFVYKAVKQIVKLLVTRENNENEGDFLTFFTGSQELKDGCTMLSQILTKLSERLNNKIYCANLSGTTDKATQNHIKERSDFINNQPLTRTLNIGTGKGKFEKKIVFATEVAESSITIDGLKYVKSSNLSLVEVI